MSRKAPGPDATLTEPVEGPVEGPVEWSEVTAPFAGVVTLAVAPGDTVAAGTVVATIEAMKLEAGLTAPRTGTVSRVGPDQGQVEGGDVLVVIC